MKHPFYERPVRKRTVHKGKAVSFRVDTVRLSTGVTATREFLEHPGAVAVLPVAKPGKDPLLLFVRQYRYPVGELTLEIPAGKLDKGEARLACVRRELAEETGYRAGRVRKVLSYWPTTAFADEVIHIYLAERLSRGTARPDEDEMVEPVLLPLSRALRLVRAGRIKDSKTLIALLAYAQSRPAR